MYSDKINLAIREWLDSCCSAPAPLMELVLFAEELASDADWTNDEVAEVTRQVFPILFRMTDVP